MPDVFIICSAIHYDDGKEYVHQPFNIKTGYIVAGRRHHNCVTTHAYLTKLKGNFHNGTTQGFLLNTGAFVNREAAAIIAFESGQIKTPKERLFSEDIY